MTVNLIFSIIFLFHISRTPEGLEDISKLPVLFAALLENEDVEWTEEDLAKLASRNLIRVLKQVESVRDDLSQIPPYQDWIPDEDILSSEKDCRSE